MGMGLIWGSQEGVGCVNLLSKPSAALNTGGKIYLLHSERDGENDTFEYVNTKVYALYGLKLIHCVEGPGIAQGSGLPSVTSQTD